MALVTDSVRANGLSFTYDQAGSGEAVALCLHGFPESRFSWRNQLPMLADTGWRAVAPDLRGYGQTARPRGRGAYRLEMLLDDVTSLFDALGAKRRLLIGHDWGGLIAWAFAMERRRPLDGLIVMNAPHPTVAARVLRASPAQRRRSWYVAFFQLPFLPELAMTARHARAVRRAFSEWTSEPKAFPPAVLDRYAAGALAPGAMKAMINYYRVALHDLRRLAEAPQRIDTPTLLVWGDDDRALGPELTQGYERLVPDLRLERLPGVSHWVQQDAPAEANARLLRWMGDKGLLQDRPGDRR